MSINVNKDNIYMIVPNGRYESSEKIGAFMEKDFTLFARVKINKENIPFDKDVFIVSRNGKHSGLSIRLNEYGEFYLNCGYWFVDIKSGEDKYINSIFIIPETCMESLNDYVITCDDTIKKMKYFFNGEKIGEIDYTGYIKENHTNSFLWVGCGNMISEDEHAGIGDFDIKLIVGIEACLSIDEIEKTINNEKNFYIDKDYHLPVLSKDVSFFNYYKIYSDFDDFNNYKIWNRVDNGIFFQKYIKGNIFF